MECQAGRRRQRGSQHIPPGKGRALTASTMGTPFYGYLYSDVSELFGECPPADQTKDGACKGISAHKLRNLFKQRINQKGWHTYYEPDCAGAVYAARGRHAGFITYDDEVSTYTRVWYSDWQWNLGGVFMWSIDADYDGQTQDLLDQAYLASLPRSTDTRPGRQGQRP